MYTLFRHVPARVLFAIQAPAFMISFLVAEFFYKFKSFALECLAFLATWFVIDLLATSLRNARAGGSESSRSS